MSRACFGGTASSGLIFTWIRRSRPAFFVLFFSVEDLFPAEGADIFFLAVSMPDHESVRLVLDSTYRLESFPGPLSGAPSTFPSF